MSLSEYIEWLALAVVCVAVIVLLVPVIYRKFNITWEPWLFKKYSISPDVGTRLLGVALLLWILSYVIDRFF